MNNILRDMLNRFVLVYLDDISYFFPKELEVQIHRVRIVLKRLLENRLYVRAEKCEYHESQPRQIPGHGGMAICRQPKTGPEVCSFL